MSHCLDTTGVIIFTNERHLRTIPEPHRQCVVDYAADRIVFHPLGEPEFVIALVSPSSFFVFALHQTLMNL
jgi:hypothetical protein